MADKMTCPGCDSHSSSVLADFERGDRCRFCGLSAEAAQEIMDIREKRANAAVEAAFKDLRVRLDKAERELATATRRLTAIRDALDENEREAW